MKQVKDIKVSGSSYESNYEAIYESDSNITEAEAEALMNKHYRMFPIAKSAYQINGKQMTVSYTMDSCD